MASGDMFMDVQEYLNAETDLKNEIRDVVKELEQTAREMVTLLAGIHKPGGTTDCWDMNSPLLCPNGNDVKEITKEARSLLPNVHSQYKLLASKSPANQYYRYHDFWRFVSQKCVFVCSLIIYLEEERLLMREEAAKMLEICVDADQGFHLDLEDYLMGLLQLASELSRLAVNSVTSHDFARPIRIGQFVRDLDTGFRLLNLKNDSLRKRFDGLKYDLKKIEEVNYDISIRGLVPKESAKADDKS